jgi:hypothetical protein
MTRTAEQVSRAIFFVWYVWVGTVRQSITNHHGLLQVNSKDEWFTSHQQASSRQYGMSTWSSTTDRSRLIAESRYEKLVLEAAINEEKEMIAEDKPALLFVFFYMGYVPLCTNLYR